MFVSFSRFVVCTLFMLTTLSLQAADFILLVQSSNYEKDPNFALERQWLDGVEKASNGRLKVELIENGGVVDYNETLDAMKLGLLDGHMTSFSYFGKKDPGFGLLGNTIGAWSSPDELLEYMYDAGGNELLQKLYDPYGIKVVGTYTAGLEAFVSKVPIDGVDDLKGVTLRSPDALVTGVFSAAGAKPIELPGGQVLEAMKKGTIVAADYSVFSANQKAGMNDVATHPVYPGFHSMPVLDFSVSKKSWNALPSDLQALLKSAVRDFSKTLSNNAKELDLKAVAEAKKNSNITIHKWSDAERRKFRLIAQDVWKEVSVKSPNSLLIYDSLTKYLNSK